MREDHASIRLARSRASRRAWAWVVAVLFLAPFAMPAAAVEVLLFWSIGCPHCDRAIAFLERVAAADPEVRLQALEVSRNRDHAARMVRTAERLGVEAGSVPLIVVGDRAWVGYADDASTGREIAAQIGLCKEQRCPAPDIATPTDPRRMLPETVRLPLIGELHLADFSLPLLTVILAAVDGFNPCATWVLVFLLGLLAGMKDRVRMWLIGIAFVGASALVYLLILGAWLNVLRYAAALAFVRIAIGAVALAGGTYYLRRFAINADMRCEITAPQSRRRVMERLEALVYRPDLLAALAGVAVLAFVVNLVEFLCSAGIPAVFTQVLALSDLRSVQYFGFLVLYVLVFMLDDLALLVIGLKTLEWSGLTTRFARWSNAVGGVVLIGLGMLLIFRPEWLAFA